MTRMHVELASPAYLGLDIFLNNYFAMYIRVELASPAYSGLGIS